MTAYEWPADGSSACSLVEASAQARPNCSDSVGYGHASIFTNSANPGRIIAYFAHELDQTTWSRVGVLMVFKQYSVFINVQINF